MTAASKRLWELLPGLYRARDAQRVGHPLERFVEVLGTELDRLHDAVRALADDHFVERASADGIRLLAELLGAELLHDDLRANRGIVANSVQWRRRRGTQATLDQVLTITSGWSAEVDESFRSLLHTQDLRYLVPWRGRTAVLWDPIAIADPLSRNAPDVALPARTAKATPPEGIGRRGEESLDATLRRMGRADAGNHAASPRTFDALGWSRPDVAIIRTDRLLPLELEEVEPAAPVVVPAVQPSRGLRGIALDPLGRDVPLVWRKPLDSPGTIETLTEIHEPPNEVSTQRSATTLLTPTALAADGDIAERSGALELRIDGVQLVGPARVEAPGGPFEFGPFAAAPVLRFADPRRPGPSDEWLIKLIARQPGASTVMAAVRANHSSSSDFTVADQARTALGGATVAIRMRRTAGTGARRSPTGQWSFPGNGARLGPPLGGAIGIGSGPTAAMLRPELHVESGKLRLAICSPVDLTWRAVPLTGEVPEPERGVVLVAESPTTILLLAPERDANGELTDMVLFRVRLDADAGVVTRLVGKALQPPAREDAAAVLLNGHLYLHGGANAASVLGDLWSIATDGSQSEWTPHLPRNPIFRRFATLLAQGDRLWLFGGESESGHLEPSVWSLSTTASRPRWEPGPRLPFEPDAPGVICARRRPTGFVVLAWADTTRPRAYDLEDSATSWQMGSLESAATNPPAIGEAVFVGDEFVVCGPAPLPACEVVFCPAGEAVLIHLPALDLVVSPIDVGETLLDDEANNPGISEEAYLTFHVADNGSTFVAGAADELLHAREGGALHASLAARAATDARYSVPERLARYYYLLRQRSLGRWDLPMHVLDDGVIGLDPRLGRVLLPEIVGDGRLSVSYLVGRPSGIGAGFLPVDREIPAKWQESDAAPPTPPERREARASVVAWVDPVRAGQALLDGEREVPIVANLERALACAANGPEVIEQPLIGVLRSSTLPPARLSANLGNALSIVATDYGATPLVRSDSSGVSLAIFPSRSGLAETQLWLAGLWLEGRLELAMGQGQADVRYCTIGQPGHLGLRLPGAEHDSPLTRRVIPEADIELRLYGCVVAALELPPWVRVIAAGCTFDAGSCREPALRAAGASVLLRHCTVHGQTTAGELRASSCVFAGSVRVDRRDRGWLRHSLVAEGGAPPRVYRSITGPVAFASISQTSPHYLVLSDNNGDALLQAGEFGQRPGAHGDWNQRTQELSVRTEDFLPVGLVPHHVDRTTHDLNRMNIATRRAS